MLVSLNGIIVGVSRRVHVGPLVSFGVDIVMQKHVVKPSAHLPLMVALICRSVANRAVF